jgi:hypothetical protein
MSSDYVSRLRAELLRAGAAGQASRRRAHAVRRIRPLAAAVAVCLLAAGVVSTLPGERRETPTQDAATLTYRVQTGDAARAAQILRQRLNTAGITAQVTAGDRTLTITAPAAARADVTALTAPGRFAMYDWERSVLGPDGRPAPTDPAMTGGQDAGHTAALTQAEARSRAAKRPGARALQAAADGSPLREPPRSPTRTSRAHAPARTPPAATRPSRSTSRRAGKTRSRRLPASSRSAAARTGPDRATRSGPPSTSRS